MKTNAKKLASLPHAPLLGPLAIHAVARRLADAPPVNDPRRELDELVRKAARGDARAVGAIAIAFGPDLLAIARQATDQEADAEDAVQEVFLLLLEARSAGPPPDGDALAYLFDQVVTTARALRERRNLQEIR